MSSVSTSHPSAHLSSTITLEQFWDTCAKESFRVRYAPTLFHQYARSMEQYILPHLGQSSIAAVTTAQIHRFTSELIRSEGLSVNTIRGLYSILRSLFRCANAAGLLREDPMQDLATPAAVRWYTSLTAAQLLTVFPYMQQSRFCNAYLLILYTGLSPSEIFGIRKSCLDEANGLLTINLFVREPRRRAYHTPEEETQHCRRTIPLSKQAAACLIRQCEAVYADGKYSEDRYLFSGTSGAIPHYRYLTQLRSDSRNIAEKTGVQGFGALMLRNTFMQLSLCIGTSPKVLQDYMGFRHLPHILLRANAAISQVSDALGSYYHTVYSEGGSSASQLQR